MTSRSCSLAITAVLTAVCCSLVVANPSHKSVDTPLAIHGTGAAPEWHREASRLYEDARNKLLNYLEKEKKNSIRTINAEDLGKTHLMITMMRRGGNWLEIWGEPAGSDFVLRGNVMHLHMSRLINASQAYPATQKYMQNFREWLAKSAQLRTKELNKIEKLCNEQKWPQAEAALFKVYDTLEPGIVFLQPSERPPIYQPFLQVDDAIRRAMSKLRAEASAEEIKKAIGQLTPTYAATLAEVKAAADQLSSGSATWRGTQVTGPQLIEKIVEAWRETQVKAHQYRAKNWALAHRINHGGAYHDSGMLPDERVQDPIAAEYSAFSKEMATAVASLVAASATRATPETAATDYAAYLRVLAPISREANDAALTAQLENALNGFLSRSPALEKDVTAYAAATNDVLRWRARLAAAQSAAKVTEFAPIVQRFRDGTLSGKVDGNDYIGLINPPPSGELQPQLMAAAPDTMTVAVDRLIGQKATVEDIFRISPNSKAAIVRYRDRTYATVSMPLDIQSEIDALKLDLQASEQTPPLTLAAMQAITTAERNDMVAIGGDISGAHLEAVITRFAALPASAVAVTRLGQLSPERFDGTSLRNMLMRFEITPRWVRHDYFFSDVSAPAANLTAQR